MYTECCNMRDDEHAHASPGVAHAFEELSCRALPYWATYFLHHERRTMEAILMSVRMHAVKHLLAYLS